MDKNEYLIAAEVPANAPIEKLSEALQKAYDDGGAAGLFRVIVTHQPSYFVVFLRSAEGEDADNIRNRLAELDGNVEHAAQVQLAAELEGWIGPEAVDVVTVLRDGDAQIIDFEDTLLQLEG